MGVCPVAGKHNQGKAERKWAVGRSTNANRKGPGELAQGRREMEGG